MSLCCLCERLTTWEWTTWQEIPHHRSYAALCESVFFNCPLCALLKNGLLDWMEKYAEEYHFICDWRPFSCENFLLQMDNMNGEEFKIVPYHWEIGDENQEYKSLDGFCYRRNCLEDGVFFKLKTPDPVGNQKYIPGRPQSISPDINLALSWLKSCLGRHDQCNLNSLNLNKVLPTRLLQISVGLEKLSLKLIKSPNYPLQYVALSHCWGGAQPLCTTTMNYNDHANGICFSALPKTFQDATTVANHFGLQYLWIDSLCIIQDSKEDWEAECPRMGDVYSNALLTIAASDAPNSGAGFLKAYITPPFPSLEIATYNGVKSNPLVIEYAMLDRETVAKDSGTLLSTRGWVMQERMLSPRILSFRKNRTTWECYTCCFADDLHDPYIMTREGYSLTPKEPILALRDSSTAFKYWYQIVTDYSRCKLSYKSDKLPALSGLAQLVSTLVNSEYVAGIWRADAHVGLSWYPLHDSIVTCSVCAAVGTEKSQYRSPSWSWAASDCNILLFPNLPTRRDDAEILSVATIHKGAEPFGEVIGGIITAKGRSRRGYIRLKISDTVLAITGKETWGEFNVCSADIEGASVGILHVDCSQCARFIAMTVDDEVEVTALLLSYILNPYTKWLALALERVQNRDGKDCFRRIGFIHCQTKHETGYKWFENVERDVIEII